MSQKKSPLGHFSVLHKSLCSGWGKPFLSHFNDLGVLASEGASADHNTRTRTYEISEIIFRCRFRNPTERNPKSPDLFTISLVIVSARMVLALGVQLYRGCALSVTPLL